MLAHLSEPLKTLDCLLDAEPNAKQFGGVPEPFAKPAHAFIGALSGFGQLVEVFATLSCALAQVRSVRAGLLDRLAELRGGAAELLGGLLRLLNASDKPGGVRRDFDVDRCISHDRPPSAKAH